MSYVSAIFIEYQTNNKMQLRSWINSFINLCMLAFQLFDMPAKITENDWYRLARLAYSSLVNRVDKCFSAKF